MQHDNDNNPVSFISMFSGIEAASVAFNPLGWRAIRFAEIEKFPSAVLAHHYPNVPNVGDMSKHDWTQYSGKVDIVCGGPPCQAFSVAGLRESLNDDRGNLSLVYMKALHAIKPRNAIIENVPGWLSTKDNAFGCFLAGLVGADSTLPPPTERNGKRRRWPNAGMVAGPKGRAAWRVLDAQFFGLAQRRKRVILVADFGNGADPAAVLFEPESVRRDSPPSRETGQGVAPTISARTKGGGGLGTDFDLDGGLVPSTVNYAPSIARCIATREGSSQDYESTTMVAVGVSGPVSHALTTTQRGATEDGTGRGTPVVCVTGPISHALKAEGADASEDGTGRGTPIVAFALNSHVGCADGIATNSSHASGGPAGFGVSEELAYSLRAGRTQSVAQTVALRGREGGATAELGGDVATALRASSGGGDKPHVLTSAVRRLTPRECERLQGFQFRCAPTYPGAWQDDEGRWWSPDYTSIPYRKVSARKLDADYTKYLARGNPKNLAREEAAALANDGPRYKALGNSWAVPLFTWLGARITHLMPPIAANDNNKESVRDAA